MKAELGLEASPVMPPKCEVNGVDQDDDDDDDEGTP